MTDRQAAGWAAVAGIVAVGTGVALGELAAGLVSPSLSPVTAVGGAVIDAVPPGVKEWAIALFGTADKVALLGGMGLLIAALAALSGIVELRRRFAGVAIIAVFGAVGLVAVLGRAELTANAVPVPLLAAAVGMVLLRWLVGRLGEWRTDAGLPSAETPSAATTDAGLPPAETQPAGPGPTAQPPSRRRFFQSLGGTAAVAVVAGLLATTFRGAAAAVSELRSKLALPAPESPAPPIPAGAEVRLDGVGPLVTPNKDFYRIDTALRVPVVDPAQWTLKVTGLVENEVSLDFAALLAKPLIERHVTIACVSNEVGGDLIGNARWLGWPVRELLALAGPKDGADMVLSRSADGWTAGTPLEVLTDNRDALLAIGMNGEPLPLEHGFPVRLIVPGLYGYVSATKWVTELKVTRFADDVGYWTPRGWSERGPVKTSSRIDVPRDGRSVSAGTVAFGGVAWAQHTGIGRVELRINRGAWQPAELAPGISKDTWYQWKLAVPLSSGQYEVQVRATDLDGVAQVEDRAPVAPSGATGFHTVRVDVKS
ncbi:molybdopterin-dependent oxidoreductase [Arthrobacter sp. PsM3]|uniref:molybdopterin-dependent oxidoreductase n=1 Tax=Arthrobacter sp. PsM3 TaxID=3030531 RepID=UPI00263AB068|nr:molybdopterin-dependent oxidoreductase [Arthrobacter sp. PsM3]MDN4645479.1 molybdopterin-dependent oxidoreductase [Arthrobacter sp. PsM3]